jgi:hypothetical protein
MKLLSLRRDFGWRLRFMQVHLQVGEASRFDVITRDMFGDGRQCDPHEVSVRVVHLSPAQDENSVKCFPENESCNKCGETLICFVGLTEATGSNAGSCAFTYTPASTGMYQVSVAVPSALSGTMTHIEV